MTTYPTATICKIFHVYVYCPACKCEIRAPDNRVAFWEWEECDWETAKERSKNEGSLMCANCGCFFHLPRKPRYETPHHRFSRAPS